MVVIHDKTLDRTTDCAGHVKDQMLAYINACDTEPAGSHPPGFRQALIYLKATDLKIRAELKGTWTSRQVETFVDEIALEGLTSRTIAALVLDDELDPCQDACPDTEACLPP